MIHSVFFKLNLKGYSNYCGGHRSYAPSHKAFYLVDSLTPILTSAVTGVSMRGDAQSKVDNQDGRLHQRHIARLQHGQLHDSMPGYTRSMPILVGADSSGRQTIFTAKK